MKKGIPSLIFVCLFVLGACAKPMEEDNHSNHDLIRKPAVAGQFYPSEKTELQEIIKSLLDPISKVKTIEPARAILVPHAGFVFSGPVAAAAYKQLEGKSYDTVVLLGSAHSDYFQGLAIDESEAWQTPLGITEIDFAWAEKFISAEDNVFYNKDIHAFDHNLEVQIPFLQSVLEPGFKIVPILIGANGFNLAKQAEKIGSLLGKNDLLVVSSDLSHYPKYEDAQKTDVVTLEKIKNLNMPGLEEHIRKTKRLGLSNLETCVCGLDAVNILITIALQKNWQAQILAQANSGDVPEGNKDKVVGYGAVGLYISQDTEEENSNSDINNTQEKQAPSPFQGEGRGEVFDLSENSKSKLLALARQTVEEYLKQGKIKDFQITDPFLRKPAGAFVTIHKEGKLRGCIGQTIPSGDPLWQVVQVMAIEAATGDPRFSSLEIDELPKVNFEVSVLTPPEQIDDWQKIELGRHGVIVSKGFQKGVFLPQVAEETKWTLEEFLGHLCQDKAGLDFEAYKNDKDVKIEVFEAIVFGESRQ